MALGRLELEEVDLVEEVIIQPASLEMRHHPNLLLNLVGSVVVIIRQH